MARLALWLDLFEQAHLQDLRVRQEHMRKIRGLADVMSIDEPDFIESYRLNKSSALDLLEQIKPLMHKSLRSDAISTEVKMLTTLAFYASGSFQKGMGHNKNHCISQATVSNAVGQVTDAINNKNIQTKFIYFPRTREERNSISQKFYDEFGIPGVLGCVDATHIHIIRPAQHKEKYINSKGYPSINAQIICDADLNILSIDSSFGGSNHDSFIWENHSINHQMQKICDENEPTWILGDSGYPQSKWLMTPMLDAGDGSPEELYTKMHMSAWSTVERTIGVLKARWRCLLVARKLFYDPVTAGLIINACVMLHNIANRAGLPITPLTTREAQEEARMQIVQAYSETPEEAEIVAGTALAEGRVMREKLINRLWLAR